jgi:hypothetical protein
MSQLLRAICDLPSLHFVSLPKGVLKGAYTAMHSPPYYRWPRSLTHLQLNGVVPGNPNWWNGLVADLPHSLRTLTLNLQNTFGRPYRLDFLGISDTTAEQVTSLYVKHGTWGRSEIVIFAEVFPNLKHITLPYSHFNFEDLYHSLGQAVVAAELEYLYLVDASSIYNSEQPTVTRPISMDGLDVIISRFPKLRRIEIPESYFMDFANPFGNVNLDDLQDKFHKRWPAEPESEVGVFLGPSLRDDEPSWIKQTWGIPSTLKARPAIGGDSSGR